MISIRPITFMAQKRALKMSEEVRLNTFEIKVLRRSMNHILIREPENRNYEPINLQNMFQKQCISSEAAKIRLMWTRYA